MTPPPGSLCRHRANGGTVPWRVLNCLPMRIFWPLATGVLLALASAPAAMPTLSFEDVEPGMKGSGRTVFSGTKVESFDVEILGKLPNIGPDQDLILARLSGGPLEETGVMAGMSGSPVFVDGKLIGAVAYTWGFTREPVAGITPIGEMLEIAARGGMTATAARASPLHIDGPALERLFDPRAIPGFLLQRFRTGLGGSQVVSPLAVPLTVSGVGARGFARIESDLVESGFLPLQATPSGRSSEPSPTLEPGSAMGLKLTRGDVEMAATGTVTWVDGKGVLAFGHPLFGLGGVDLPLTGARVEMLLSSLERSARMATPLSEVGAIRQDRAAGVFGELGSRPRMLPVRVQLSSPDGEARSYSFDIADDALLSPLLLYSALNGILASRESVFGSATLRLSEGSVIKMVGEEDVLLDNLYAGPTAFDYSTGIAAYVLYLLMNNDWEPPRIAGINLLFEYVDIPLTGRIQRVSLDRYRARPGDSVEVSVVVDPFRGSQQVLSAELSIPPETPAGHLIIYVGGALGVSRAESAAEPMMPADLSQFIWLVNNLRRNDRVYVSAFSEDSGAFVGGARLPNLPPSVSSILTRPRTRGNLALVRRRGILEEEIPTDYAVEGLARLQLQVEAP